MKTCPRCKMTCTGHSECPICKADITNIPYEKRGTPIHYVFNKYFLIYLLKYYKICLISWIGTIFFIAKRLPSFDWYSIGLILWLLFSVILTLFPHIIVALNGRDNDPDYTVERGRWFESLIAACMFIVSICIDYLY